MLKRTHHSKKKGISCGIVGCGRMFSSAYAPALNHSECPMVCRGIYTPNTLRAKKASLSLRYMPDVHSDFEALLSSGIDCLIILSPNDTHYEYASRAISHGLHVLCEKPLCNRTSEIKKLQSLPGVKHTHVLVGYGLRYTPRISDTYASLKEQLTKGIPISIKMRHEVDIRRELKSSIWLGNSKRVGGGVLHHLGSHMINLLCAWFGMPVATSVQLENRKLPLEAGEDYAKCCLSFGDGLDAEVLTAYSDHPDREFASIRAQSADYNLSSRGSPERIQIEAGGKTVVNRMYPDPSPPRLASSLLHELVCCINDGKRPLTSVEDSLLTQESIEACYARFGSA